MYVESHDQQSTQSWVETVHGLRYKDYQLLAATSLASKQSKAYEEMCVLREVGTVKEFAVEMEGKGLLEWWKGKMGYAGD